ncbi:hypothetical protein QL285_045183 [Trifolium repens]|nr:hypothetical protein QL285_045183 [Trifolium repens]
MHFISCINNHDKHAFIKQARKFLLEEYRFWSLNHKKGSLTFFLASRLVNCLPSRLVEKPYPISSPVNGRFSEKKLFYKMVTTVCPVPQKELQQASSTLSGSPKGMTAIPEIRRNLK